MMRRKSAKKRHVRGILTFREIAVYSACTGAVRCGRRSSCSGPSGCPGAGTQEKIEKQLLFFGKPCYNDAVVTRSSTLLYLKFREGILCY